MHVEQKIGRKGGDSPVIRRVIIGMVIVVLCALGIKEGRYFILVDNFGVVEEGKIYRSGQMRPYQLDRLIRKYGLRTVINTREMEAPVRRMESEAEVCGRNGVEMVRIPMPGDGRGTYEQFDQALHVLQETNRLPALIHCARGTHRTGAIVAAYRVRVQGWDPVQALEEMQGYRFKSKGHVLTPYLHQYFERVERE